MEEATITLQDKGAIHVVPDVTRLEVKIDQWFADYGKAYEQARKNTAWMVKILEYNKKPGKLAKTVCLDIEDYTEDEYDDKGKYIRTVKKGYTLDQRIKIDLPVGNHIVNCIVRGIGKFIPSSQINIGYTLQDQRPSELKMLARAISDAKEKATIMAETAGCILGRLISIEYGHQNIHVMSQARNIHSNSEAKASTSDSLDITPDDLVISDTVHVTFAVVNPA